MHIEIEGLNVHHKLSWKKPLGSKRSIGNQIVSHPQNIAGVPLLGAMGAAPVAFQDVKTHVGNSGVNNPTGVPDQATSEADLITRKYNELAKQYQGEAVPLRDQLAKSLTTSGQNLFQAENPYLLQDLNARGLATSGSAVNAAQAQALGEIAAQNRSELNNFDTDVFNATQGIKATGTGSSLQRLFDVHDQNAQMALAKSLARRRSRDSLTSSLIGLGGNILGATIRGSYGDPYGDQG